jgi:DNA-nicking Smr family endonuclease
LAPKPFNNPFSGLKLKEAETIKPAPPPKPKAEAVLDEGALFRESIGSVTRVRKGPTLTEAPTPKRDPAVMDPELEALAELAQLVAGEGALDLSDRDEVIEGAVAGLDASLVRRLRKGDFAVQAHVDLHGLSKSEAKEALERFILESQRKGHRCVLVVHGRGLHSKDQIPVLKEGVQVWLARGRIGRQVLAFTTARPHDGGAGAVYVLLRR